MIASLCEPCPAPDLIVENEEVWEIFCRFPGMMEADFFGGLSVKYGAAERIAARRGIADELYFIEALEAIAKGLSAKR